MATTSNFGWTTPDDTDLVKDGALAIRTLGNNIDSSLVDLKGGTTGQILAKNSNTDLDYTWINNDQGDITEVQAGTGISVASGTGPVPVVTNTVATTFDAKGDLVVGTGADTFAKLTTGSNGDSLYAASAETTGLRYNPPVASLANPVINGGFDIWQRGTSIATGAARVYVSDRWSGWRGSLVAGMTVSRQATGDTTNLPNIQYCARVQRDSGNTSTQEVKIVQDMETVNSIPFAGKTVTVSFYARKGANYSNANSQMSVELLSGTGTDQILLNGYTGQVNVANATPVLTTSWQRFVISGTVGATATQLGIALASQSLVGTAGAADYFEVTGVQIDVGTWTASTAPTFRRSGNTLAGELAACQRYYWRLTGGNGNYAPYGIGTASSTTVVDWVLNFPTVMRTNPTVVEYSTLLVGDGVNSVAVTNLTIPHSNTNKAYMAATASSLTQFRPYLILNNNNSTTAHIAVSAEL